jgi:predicted DNA-binding transcriptional regulator YafY
MHNKTPFVRYKIINACLTSKTKPFPSLRDIKAALAKHDIVVSTRSLESDLEAMRFDKSLGFHAPIQFNRKFRGYHYSDPDYTIEKLPLSHEELEAFELIVDSFKRFRGANILNEVVGMFDKLDQVVHQLKNKKGHAPTVDFEDVPYSKGIEHFDRLYKAIQQKQPLIIKYQKFDKQLVTSHLFHPYLLKEYRFRWYVLGFSETRNNKVVLALDRIDSITQTKKLFKPFKGTNLQQYFSNTIGVTINNSGVKEIKLRFSPSQGNYIKTQYLHSSQEIISDTKEGLIIILRLIPNYELLQTLLAFGPEVEVLEPKSLRTELKDMLAKSLALYQ